ncbi:UNVERIFIED_CONTAM: hypothetical protein GTU68_032284, partial [Idotea baltica]|nr:hypothetical protein [Idotea baltica]
MLAFGKLNGSVKSSFLNIPGLQYINYFIFAGILALIFFIASGSTVSATLVFILLTVSLIYGVTFVAPIGGADMPVVISLLNSFTGLTAALAGIIYSNQIMLLGGILVGSSGTILTILMCNAMNRPLSNVLLGGMGGASSAAKGAVGDQVAKEVNATDAAILMKYASTVVFVPGYGLAVAQAQKTCKDLESELVKNGVDVFYAIHPVAGRMPGHMNVLLAEADVSYDKLLDLDASNSKLSDADVAIIVGANDVV